MNLHALNHASRILLTLTFAITSMHECRAASDSKVTAVDNGKWGGTHVEMQVTSQGATLEFDCAEGTISEPLLLDPTGKFRGKGMFLPQHGGPTMKDETKHAIEVVYSGTVNGKTMKLEFTLIGEDIPEQFTLERGKSGLLRKCA